MPSGGLNRIAIAIGSRFGRWTVIAYSGFIRRKSMYLVRCECGYEANRHSRELRKGATNGCLGCRVAPGPLKHGETRSGARSREYVAWCAMWTRCTNPNQPGWKNYGGRGIRITEDWVGQGGFERFLASVGRKPGPGYSLDRIDNDRGYEPGNVRWATRTEQSRNRRNVKAAQ